MSDPSDADAAVEAKRLTEIREKVEYRARKSMVSWYPGYQPMSNLAANFGWAKGTDSHHLRINSQ